MNKTVKGLFDFIEKSPSQFHVVENQRKVFLAAGFEELTEANAEKIFVDGYPDGPQHTKGYNYGCIFMEYLFDKSGLLANMYLRKSIKSCHNSRRNLK